MLEGLAGLYLVIILFLVVLAICWIVLPFAILGTKPLLRQLLTETKRTNQLLEHLASSTRVSPGAVDEFVSR